MSTLTKIFNFTSDSEGWTATTGNANTIGAWYPQHTRGWSIDLTRRPLDPLLTMGGCLRTTCRDASSSENYWQLSTTWEALGVPAGATVTAVQFNYLYRWGVFKIHDAHPNLSTFTNTQTGSGPAEFRDSSSTLIDTFSTRQFCIARDAGGACWKAYPVGTGSYTPIDADNPSGWAHSVGANLAVPAPQQASGTTIKFRLRNLLPAQAGENNKIRIKQDRIKIIVTYTMPSFIRGNTILRGNVNLRG